MLKIKCDKEFENSGQKCCQIMSNEIAWKDGGCQGKFFNEAKGIRSKYKQLLKNKIIDTVDMFSIENGSTVCFFPSNQKECPYFKDFADKNS